MGSGWGWGNRGLFPGSEYAAKVKATSPTTLIAYWMLSEPSGTAAICEINTAQNGTHSGMTLGQTGIGDGHTSILADGANDHTTVYSTTFRDAFSGVAGTLAGWAKVSAVGVWGDSTNRWLVNLLVDADNQVYIRKTTNSNQLRLSYIAGGTSEAAATTSLAGTTDWFHMAITWDKAPGTGEVKYYLNGASAGTTDTALGVWAGSLVSTNTCIGASSTTPANVFDGYQAHWNVWTSALTAAQVATLAVVGG
ncbi:unnamed protein product [marine sediment metagenome]|uniref:LamG-like jellyroll fold domain-containing protein n=1 Tax=marine sediment metagenome TaxID=412755 RepID=X0TV06_9ZZZZ